MPSGRRGAAVALLPPKGRCRLARSGPGRAWLIVGAIGCLGALAFAALLGGIVFFVFGSMRKSGAYQDAMRELRGHTAAVEALGEPIEEGWFTSGSINVTGPSGEASLAIPVHGPRGRGKLYVEAVKRAGQWRMNLLQLAPETGPRIDLLAAAGPDDEGAARAETPAPQPPTR